MKKSLKFSTSWASESCASEKMWCSGYTKTYIAQKRVLRFMYFAKKNEHTIPLFVNAKILPQNFLYYKTFFLKLCTTLAVFCPN